MSVRYHTLQIGGSACGGCASVWNLRVLNYPGAVPCRDGTHKKPAAARLDQTDFSSNSNNLHWAKRALGSWILEGSLYPRDQVELIGDELVLTASSVEDGHIRSLPLLGSIALIVRASYSLGQEGSRS
jgi:hypothetical protein